MSVLKAGARLEACLEFDLALCAEGSHQVLWQDVTVLVTVFNTSHRARNFGLGDGSLVLLLLDSFGRLLRLNGRGDGRTGGVSGRDSLVWGLEGGDILAQLCSFSVSHEDIH